MRRLILARSSSSLLCRRKVFAAATILSRRSSRNCETLPGDTKTQSALIAAYLQKLRETSNGSYLELASRLVNRMIEQDGGNFAAQRFQNEIDLQRHDFKTVAARARDMTKYEPSDPGTWGNLADALMELGEYDEAGKAYMKMFSLRVPVWRATTGSGYFAFVTGDAPRGITMCRAGHRGRWLRRKHRLVLGGTGRYALQDRSARRCRGSLSKSARIVPVDASGLRGSR